MLFANAYSVTKHYGGPEEGGWWYDWYELLQTVPCHRRHAEPIVKSLKEKYAGLDDGRDLSSVLSTGIVAVYLETAPGEGSKERPHYE